MKSAEVFGFGRAKKYFYWPTGTSDLALSSPDGESRRPVGKDECRGYPKGRLIGVPFLLVLFFGHAKKSNSPSRRNKMLVITIM